MGGVFLTMAAGCAGQRYNVNLLVPFIVCASSSACQFILCVCLLPGYSPSSSFLHGLVAAAAAMARSAQPQELSSLLFVLAKWHAVPAAAELATLTDAVGACIKAMDGNAICSSIWALVRWVLHSFTASTGPAPSAVMLACSLCLTSGSVWCMSAML